MLQSCMFLVFDSEEHLSIWQKKREYGQPFFRYNNITNSNNVYILEVL